MQKEINKFLKKLSAEKLRKNYKECIEIYNIIGGLYTEVGSYEEAVHYHEQALDLCKTTGDRHNTALAFRYIGEAKAALGDFAHAISTIKRYLELAQRINNKVEIQRAWTTLGRVYLMQAQALKEKVAPGSNVTERSIKEIAREAERRFQNALTLAECVRDQVDTKEYAQMTSALLVNLGLINDICYQHKEAVTKFKKAMEICKAAKLKEDLFRCQIVLAGIYRQRDEVKEAVKTSEEALQTARSIGKKILICDALIERGLVRICQRDFKNAKRTFAQAYLEKSQSEEDHLKAIRYTKLAHMIATAHEKISMDTSASENRMKLCDKLGDLFVEFENFKLAIEFYRRAFADAKACGKPKTELARILYSLAETYSDSGQYEHALVCYNKELKYRGDNKIEQCQSLIKIAHMLEYLEKDSKEVSAQYEKALEIADKNPKLMYSVLKFHVPYLKMQPDHDKRYRELQELFDKLKSYPEVEDEIEAEGESKANDLEDEIANVDDIITDDEDNDEVLMIGRRRAKGKTKFKQNEVGDTPLHEACIKGDLKRVKSLLLQGHEVNPRDNAGWIPLHEACNHGHYEVAEHLIENGADVNNRGVKGLSPLHDAASNGHFDIMRLLIKNGANVISLTDTGETVLSCLRDYKNRCFKEMSNAELIDYKQMEAELLNVMDKCGFNLMSESIKNLGSRSSSGPSGLRSTESQRSENRSQSSDKTVTLSCSSNSRSSSSVHDTESRPPSAPSNVNPTDKELSRSSVREYRDAIVTLKRKRPLDTNQPSKKASQPATIRTSMNTSVSTKQWLLSDDVIEEDYEIDDVDMACVDDDDDDFLVGYKEPMKGAKRNEIIIDDDDDDLEFLSDSMTTTEQRDEESYATVVPESKNISSSDIFSHPLTVEIEDRKLMIPLKDESTTIGDLKKMVIDRYTILVNSTPKISLAPKSEPKCFLFDGDLCKDVLRESLVATIDSWQLKSIEETYLEECGKTQLQPLDFIKIELRGIDEVTAKLDLSFMRFPAKHKSAIITALRRRSFTTANLKGAGSLLECQARSAIPTTLPAGLDLIECIGTWNNLTRLNLKCTGLVRSQFESICSFKSKLCELLDLDVSFNSIVYKQRLEFTEHIERLRKICPKLRRLDMRKNHLQFVKSMKTSQPQSKQQNNNSTSHNKDNVASNESPHEEPDISSVLELSGGIEILASGQYDYPIYSSSL